MCELWTHRHRNTHINITHNSYIVYIYLQAVLFVSVWISNDKLIKQCLLKFELS